MWCYCWYSFHGLYIGMPINLIMAIMVVIWVPLHFWALRTVSPQAGYKYTFFFCLSRANSVLRLFFPWSTPLLRKKGFLFVICMCFYVLLVLFSNLIKSLTNCIKGNKKNTARKQALINQDEGTEQMSDWYEDRDWQKTDGPVCFHMLLSVSGNQARLAG